MEQIIFQENTGEFPVIVTEGEEGIRTLHFDGDERQSCIDMKKPHILQLDYTQWMMTALLIPENLNSVLVCGLGGGAVVHFIHHHHPNLKIDIVEKDARVIKAAKKYFSLPSSSNINTFNADIIDHLCSADHQDKYDLVLVDIFNQGCMAPALYASDFYRSLRDCLNENGVMAVNLWSGNMQYFSLAINALKKGSNNNYLQMSVKKKSNSIFMIFPGEIPKSRIRKVRKKALKYQKQYQLPFHTYLKRVRRTNKLMDLIQGVST